MTTFPAEQHDALTAIADRLASNAHQSYHSGSRRGSATHTEITKVWVELQTEAGQAEFCEKFLCAKLHEFFGKTMAVDATLSYHEHVAADQRDCLRLIFERSLND